MFRLFLILSLATLALSDDLSCYDCDPKLPGKCEKPDKNNAKETNCKDLKNHPQSVSVNVFSRAFFQKTTLEPKSANIEEKFVYDCVSLKYVPKTGSDLQKYPEGIYRGCVIRKEGDRSDPCRVATSSILEEGNGDVTACSSCKDSLCNRGVPKKDDDDGTGGAASFSLSGIAVLSALVCFYLAEF